MAWGCADCNDREDDQGTVVIDGICHHCGKPLCGKHQVKITDEAFAPSGSPLPKLADLVLGEQTAVHCESCRRGHHGMGMFEGLPK